MRLHDSTLQYDPTAMVISVALLFLTLASLPIAYSADISTDGFEAESSVNIGGPIVSNGAGFPFALDSFNGLELRESVDEDGESNGLDLVRRGYPKDGTSLANNDFQENTIEAGEVQWWYITKETVNGKNGTPGKGLPAYIGARGLEESAQISHELRKRDLEKRSTTVYLSLTTCMKPTSNGTAPPGSFPQLELYVSQSEKLEEPGPGKDGSLQNKSTAVGGYIGIQFDADGDVFIGVAAPNSTQYSGPYKYQIAASIDAFFHSVDRDDPFLYFVDADNSAALLVTNNLTQSEPGSANYQQWMNITPPYTMFAHNINNTELAGLEQSFCALDESSRAKQISTSVEVGMTSRGLGNKPKQQFYITGLNRSSTYNGILAMVGNSTLPGNGVIGGGGKVWKPMNFTTKAGALFIVIRRSASRLVLTLLDTQTTIAPCCSISPSAQRLPTPCLPTQTSMSRSCVRSTTTTLQSITRTSITRSSRSSATPHQNRCSPSPSDAMTAQRPTSNGYAASASLAAQILAATRRT